MIYFFINNSNQMNMQHFINILIVIFAHQILLTSSPFNNQFSMVLIHTLLVARFKVYCLFVLISRRLVLACLALTWYASAIRKVVVALSVTPCPCSLLSFSWTIVDGVPQLVLNTLLVSFTVLFLSHVYLVYNQLVKHYS